MDKSSNRRLSWSEIIAWTYDLENDYLTKGGAGLTSDELKRTLCRRCERAGADWVKTSSGFGFVKQADGSYNYQGAP